MDGFDSKGSRVRKSSGIEKNWVAGEIMAEGCKTWK